MLQNREPSVEMNQILNHSSTCDDRYHFMRSFKAHNIDGVGCNSNKDESHGIKVERTPMMFDEHIRISGDEDHKINLLSFVADAYNIFVGKYL